jgi:glyoxalase family protein
MDHPVRSLHHVTATVDEAQQDLNFCVGVLGLRLVKKTVNFDNHNVFHFYYGDAEGTPGTIWTTFPYRGWNVPVGTKGAGQVTTTSFSVPRLALAYWQTRLSEHGLEPREAPPRFDEEALLVRDPSGLVMELVGAEGDTREPWTGGGIDAANAIRGLHSVALTVRSPARTVELLTDLLGFQVVNETEGRIRLAARGESGAGRFLDVVADEQAPIARNGLGTVHHVAVAITDADEQLRLRAELQRHGLQVTDVRDRCYFNSIYFREPGGVLLEVATIPPGFAIDEAPAALGTSLKLPPWEEPSRPSIEAGLPKVVVP